jgi:hypothetical protein
MSAPEGRPATAAHGGQPHPTAGHNEAPQLY